MVKQTDVDWTYPVLAFLQDGELRYFDNALPLNEYPQWVFSRGVLEGMELVDSKGRQWFVQTVDRVSPEHPPRRWWQVWPFWEEPRDVLDLVLEQGGQVDFATIRGRVRDIFQAQAVDEDDLDDHRELLGELKKAKNLEEIGDITGSLDANGFLG